MTKFVFSSSLATMFLIGCAAEQTAPPEQSDPAADAPYQRTIRPQEFLKLPASHDFVEQRASWCYDIGSCMECVLTIQGDSSCGGGEWAYVSRWCDGGDGNLAFEYCR